jgi:hypothetical protein
MANGWAPDGAVQDQNEDSFEDALIAMAANKVELFGLASQTGR